MTNLICGGTVAADEPNAPAHAASAIWKGMTQPKGMKWVEVVP